MERRSLGGADDMTGTMKNYWKKASKMKTRRMEELGQSWGKKDKTEDAYFDYHVYNFEQQQASAFKLQK